MQSKQTATEYRPKATLALMLAALVFAISPALAAGKAAPATDLAESGVTGWCCGPQDQCKVASDTERIHDGKTAVHFRTESSEDVWFGLKPTPSPSWDASDADFIEFQLHVRNDEAMQERGLGYYYYDKENFFNNEGFFRLGDAEGNYFEFTPDNAVPGSKLLSSALRQISDGWTLFRVPLKGSNRWTVTTHGQPDLSKIDYFELHGKSRSTGFDAWIDGLKFSKAGKAPAVPKDLPEGLNPEQIEVKLLVYVVNPIIEAQENKRLFDIMNLRNSPKEWVERGIADFNEASHGLVKYKIVDWIEVDAYPIVFDTFQYTDTLWLNRERDKYRLPWDMNMSRLATDLGWDNRAMAGEFDEIWTLSWIMQSGEAGMIGEGGHGANGPVYFPPFSKSKRAYAYIGWSMERSDMFFHNNAHRIDANMRGMFGSWDSRGKTLNAHAFDRFTLVNHNAPGLAAIGECHWTPNSNGDYDTANKTFVSSNADDWLNNYPNMSGGDRREINCEEWGPKYNCYDYGFQLWKYKHMPHVPGVNDGKTGAYKHPADKGMLNNWWRYIVDVDQFKQRDGRFLDDWTAPTATITSPSPATVHGVIPVKVEATDENPIWRVDLYVDGKYYATDALAPYTFDWDASTLSGKHTLLAKVYDLPNGYEGVSEPVTMTVKPMSGYTLPVMEAIGNESGEVHGEIESPIEFTVKATDKDAPLTYSAENLPKGASFDSKTGKFSWTPAVDQNGQYWIRFTATDKDGDHTSKAAIVVVTAPIVVAGFDAKESTVDEGAGQATVQVAFGQMDPNPPVRTVKMDYVVTGGDAAGDGVDYTLKTGTLTFEPGETTKDIAVDLVDDDAAEAPETIQITLKNPVNASIDRSRKVHTLTITDNDKPADAQ